MLNRALIFSAVLFLAGAIPVANSAPTGAAPVGKTYVYTVTKVTAAPATLTLNGLGAAWSFAVVGGSAAFNIAGGSTVTLPNATAMSGNFNYAITNPTMTLNSMTDGATVVMWLDGVN